MYKTSIKLKETQGLKKDQIFNVLQINNHYADCENHNKQETQTVGEMQIFKSYNMNTYDNNPSLKCQ